jgi:predicted transcriptional regulator
MSKTTSRVNVVLGDEHAAKLRRLAERTHVSPGTLARALLSRALDEAEPSSTSVTALLDSIDGAFEQAQAGTADLQAGRYVPLDEI